MRGAIILHRQARHEQTDDEADDELFLLRQPVHADNVAETGATAISRVHFNWKWE